MNLVYLIGNGFDLKMGLNTRYSDFYRWYEKRSKSDNAAVAEFRGSIDHTSDKWSDLEWALGRYLRNVNSAEDAIAIFDDVQRNLREYLLEETKRVEITDRSSSPEFLKSFFQPTHTFRPATSKKIKEYCDPESVETHTRIILFNYTETLERLLDWKGSVQPYRIDRFSRTIQDIEHVHGFAGEKGRMALGVDSIKQIDNPRLIQDSRITDRFVKPLFNDSYELEHHYKCLNWIGGADLIVVYGLSLGQTDQTWWHKIGEWLITHNHAVLIVHFHHNLSYEIDGGPVCKYQIEQDRELIMRRLDIHRQLYERGITGDSSLRSRKNEIARRIFPTFSPALLAPE